MRMITPWTMTLLPEPLQTYWVALGTSSKNKRHTVGASVGVVDERRERLGLGEAPARLPQRHHVAHGRELRPTLQPLENRAHALRAVRVQRYTGQLQHSLLLQLRYLLIRALVFKVEARRYAKGGGGWFHMQNVKAPS